MRFKFEGFFLIGFFLLIFTLVTEHFLLATLGCALLLLAFLIDFNAKRFFQRDIFMLGYAFSTAFIVLSFLRESFSLLLIGLIGIYFALILYTLHHHKKLEIKNKKQSASNKKFMLTPYMHPLTHSSLWFLLALTLFLLAAFFGFTPLLFAGGAVFLFAFLLHIIQTVRLHFLAKKVEAFASKHTLRSTHPPVHKKITPTPSHSRFHNFHIPFKAEGFFLIGFFLFVFFLLGKQPIITLIGALLMLLAFFIHFDKKRFFQRDIFMLGYACSTAFVVLSFLQNNYLLLGIGIVGMLAALLFFTLHKRHTLSVQHMRLVSATHKQNLSLPDINVLLNANMWSLLSIIFLVFSGYLHNLILLIIGLLLSGIALTLQVIKIKNLKKKFKILTNQRVLTMKGEVKTARAKYETDFDKLIRLVQKYQTLRLSEVAKIFDIAPEKAEEWGKILEEHGLLHIHFPPIGEPELTWK